MAAPYPGVYRAKAQRLDSGRLTANIPQIFGEQDVIITSFVGDPPTSQEMGWVAFHGGRPEFPVWLSVGTGNGNGTSTGTGVTDGDKGDIVVSGTGTTWLFDPTVVTPVAKTLLDDADTPAMRTTLGLGNVDNTSDASKPVSSATTTALNLKADKATTVTGTAPITTTGNLGGLSVGVNTFGTAQPGVVPPSGGGAVNFLRADGTWALPPGAGGGISGITVKEGGVSLGTTFTSLLFTAAGFDITAAGAEATIILDLAEYTGLALPVAGGGTGATTAGAALTNLGAASAAALTTHTGATTGVHGITDTAALVTLTGTQTLTNKTMALGSNPGLTGTIAQFNAAVTDADLATTSALAAHEADTTAIHGIADTALLATTASIAAHEADTTNIHGIADTAALVTVAGTQTLTNKSVSLSTNTLTGTTALFNTALTDNDFATLAGTETLTAKTFNLLSNTLTGTTAQFNTALSDNDFATLAGTETLTGKTINLTSNTLSGTLAQFNTALSDADFASALALANHEADTTAIHGIADTALLVTLAGIQTLTNKTINLTSNTLQGTASQFNVANTDSDFYTTGGADVAVADGGTGRSTNSIANGIIAAGVLATDPLTTIGPGTAGQFLKSAGPSSQGAFANIVQADVTNLATDLLAKADKTVAVTASSPLTGGGTLAASFSIGIPASTTTVVGATRLSTLAEAIAASPLATVAVTPAAAVAGYLQLAGGTVTGSVTVNGSVSIPSGQLGFGTRSGQMVTLSGTSHGFGIQGTGGTGQDTMYSRATAAFWWYAGGAHDNVAGQAGAGGVPLMSLDSTNLRYKTSKVWHQGNQGHTADSSGINADMLDTYHATYFANQEEMEALLGDLLYVGTYDPAKYLSASNRYIPFNGATPNTITGWTFDPPTDAGVEFRCECTRPSVGVGANQRVLNGALIFNFGNTAMITYVRATDATFPVVSTTYPNEVQAVTPSGVITGGTFTLTVLGVLTGDIAWNATAANIKTAIDAAIPGNTVTVAGGPAHTTAFTLTYPNAAYGDAPEVTTVYTNLIGTDALNPPVLTVSTTTPGFPAYNATNPVRIQLRATWNAATDTLTHYWRMGGVDLLNDTVTTWTLLGSAVTAGKLLSEISIAQVIGGGAGLYYTGNVYRVWSATNGTATFDFKASDALPGQTVVTPTLVSPGNLTMVGLGMARTQLYPDPEWSGGQTVYRHGMYWVCNSQGTVDFIADDASGRYPSGNPLVADEQITLNNGDWVVAAIPGYAVNNKVLTANVATLTLTLPTVTPPVTSHTLLAGAVIDVDNVDATFDGTYTITAVTTTVGGPQTVSYAKVNADVASTAVAPTSGATVAGQTLGQVLFQYVPFSTEKYVKSQILEHLDAKDPHPQYFLEEYDDLGEVVKYAPLVHNHQAEIRQQVIYHLDINTWPVTAWSWTGGIVTLTVPPRGGLPHNILPYASINLSNVHDDLNKKWPVRDAEDGTDTVRFDAPQPTGYATPGTVIDLSASPGAIGSDPHAQYLESTEADLIYSKLDHLHTGVYEPFGNLDAHIANANPHPAANYLNLDTADALFLTPAEANAAYAISGHTHSEILEVHSTDGAVSADIWIGDQQPTVANGVAVGDLWIETAPIALQVPTMHTITVTNNAVSTPSVAITWQPWAGSEAVSTISLERSPNGSTGWVVLTTDKSLTSFTDTGQVGGAPMAANTIYYYKIKAVNAANAAGGAYSPNVSIVTKPADATGVNAVSSAYNNASVTWSAPAGGAYTYDVYVNNVFKVNVTSPLSYAATGVVENTSYTFGIKSKGSTGLYGNTVNSVITSLNGTPPDPGTPSISSIDHDSAVMTWPAVTNADFNYYEVFLNTTSKGTTTALTYTFTGLSASTSYSFRVRARDDGGLYSSPDAASSPTVVRSTSAPPDTTPPTAPTIQTFEPETTYGTMVLRCTLGTGTTQWRVDSSVNNSTWTIEQNWTARAPGAAALVIGTYAAGTTVYCRVYARDDALNTTYTNAPSYTLITTPSYITASSTNHWRASGTWNAMGTSRPVQGYYSNSSYNATGCFFYGTKPNATLYNGGRRTIMSGKIWLKRMDGGDGVDRDITLWKHQYASVPAGAPALFAGVDIDANLAWNGAAKSIALPADWANQIVANTAGYMGFAIYKSTADGTTNYMTLANLTEDANIGRLEIHHLG